MILSYNWLKELVDFDLSAEELAAELTRVGCCVEEMEKLDDDWQLVAEVTTNRPDWLCHWGVAHEIAAFTGKKLNLPEIKLPESGSEKVTDLTSVTVECEDLCPRYTARVIKGVKIAPSPEWLQKKLISLGIKPRNNVVDITNYILFEMNQPLHAFDYDRLSENRIIVRRAKDGEKFTSVFGEERELKSSMCVISDAEKAVALAGVKGGLDTGVTDDTVNVLLESAYFPQAETRKASQASQLASDSSYRYERGIDSGNVERASARAAQLICEIAGGSLADGVIDSNPDIAKPWELSMRFTRCTKLLGIRIEPVEIKKIFAGLGLKVLDYNPVEILVEVPTFRADLTREADLIEEVARCHGYENIPQTLGMSLAAAHISAETKSVRSTRSLMVGLGYHETMTDSFISEKWSEEVDGFAGSCDGKFVRVKNPVREDRPNMRTSLIAGLLEVRRVNRDVKDAGFFEINKVYVPQGDEVHEPLHLCVIDDRGAEYVRGALEAALSELKVEGKVTVAVVNEDINGFETGSVAKISVDDTVIGIYGKASKALANAHDLFVAPAILEADFNKIISLPRKGISFTPLPKFPSISRDIALVVPEAVRWAEIENAINENPDMIERIEFASCYRGKQIENGKKSMAFSITYRNPEKSFTDDEANALRDDMVKHLVGKIANSEQRI